MFSRREEGEKICATICNEFFFHVLSFHRYIIYTPFTHIDENVNDISLKVNEPENCTSIS